MTFGALPVTPQEPHVPVIAVERWREVDGALYKTYSFRRIEDRNLFVSALFAYEVNTEHNAQIRIDHDKVDLRLQTKDVGKATELDREYARFADVLFKDLVYSPSYER